MQHSCKTRRDEVEESKGAFIHVDPYDNPSVKKQLQHTVLWKIWPSMLFFTALAVLLICLDKYTSLNLGIPPTMLTVLGTVLGFTISYRTSSAYAMHCEGRRLWQNIHGATRTMSRLVWFHCPNATSVDVEDEKKETDAARALLEKKTMLNLLEAYAVSLKYYLRGETGIHYEDLYHLVVFLPKYQLPNNTTIRRGDLPSLNQSQGNSTLYDGDSESKIDVTAVGTVNEKIRFRGGRGGRKDTSGTASTSGSTTPGTPKIIGPRFPDKQLLPAHNPPKFNFIDDIFPPLAIFRSLFKFGRRHVTELLDREAAAEERARKKRKHKKQVYSGQNIPVELNLHISAWISTLQARKTIDAPTVTQLFAANSALSEALSGLERVLTTPLPFTYAVHLKHTAYLYLFFLPFQVMATLGWVTIPAVAIASFIFTGFLVLGDEIEQPLGYDQSDLDLGFFCDNIRKELRELVAQVPPRPEDFFFCAHNEPLAPQDVRSAAQLLDDKVTVKQILEVMSEGHENHTGPPERSFTEAYGHGPVQLGMLEKEEEGEISPTTYMPQVKHESMV